MQFVDVTKEMITQRNTLGTIIITAILCLFVLYALNKSILPSFEEQIMLNTIDESNRVSHHIVSMYKQSNSFKDVDGLKNDLKLEKIKVFDTTGKIIYSTDEKDIGTINTKEYFHKQVAKGEVFYKIIKSGKKTLEDRVVQIDVAEIYIPIMENREFKYAIEVYYDITKRVKEFNMLTAKMQFITSVTVLLVFLLILIKLFYFHRGQLKERLLQEKLYRSEKMASMGEMIANIAHQWRQPLSTISSSATGMLLLKRLDTLSDEQFEESCNTINENAQYLSKTIDDFRNFIKGDREVTEFKLSNNIEEFLNIVKPTLKAENINLKLNLDHTLTLKGYPNELIQCYINIFNNAKDALAEKETKEKYLFIETLQKGKRIEIHFKDSAGGISKDIISRVFDPYFTTKHQSHGTGLGLSMVYSLIVDGMKGSIEVKNKEYLYEDVQYTGAEFTIILPQG